MYILGISCYYHDAAAAILRDGKLIAAAEEERFSRIKHDFGFPENVNPYTGKVAPGNPETYLKNYYSSNNSDVSADVWVSGYYRNGTYVQGHWRSAPDGILIIIGVFLVILIHILEELQLGIQKHT